MAKYARPSYDRNKDCLSYAKVIKVICKYFISGTPDIIYQMPFPSLSCYDDWRYQQSNQNKVVVSTHLLYDYDKDFLSEDGCILK